MISINFTLIITIINFAILYVALNKILFSPMLKFLAERDKKIVQNNQDADNLKKDSELIVAQYNSKIKQGKKDAARQVDSVKQKSWYKRMSQIEAVQDENVARLESEKKAAKAQATEAQNKLSGKVKAVSDNIFVKIIGRSL